MPMPATTSGFVIASQRNGSPSSWFRITSMKAVTPATCASQDSLSAVVSSCIVGAVTLPLHPASLRDPGMAEPGVQLHAPREVADDHQRDRRPPLAGAGRHFVHRDAEGTVAWEAVVTQCERSLREVLGSLLERRIAVAHEAGIALMRCVPKGNPCPGEGSEVRRKAAPMSPNACSTRTFAGPS